MNNISNMKNMNNINNISNEEAFNEIISEKYYTAKEVSTIYNVKIKTVYSWIYQGLIEADKIGPKTIRILGRNIKGLKRSTLD